MGNDITKSPYAEFLEMICKNVLEHKPEKIAISAILPDGSTFTAAYGDCGPFDLAMLAFHMQADAIMEIVKVNAKEIVQAAEEEEEDDDEF